MATAGQIIFTKFAALAIALVAAWWWRSDGFGWPATIAAGIGNYVFWKIAIAVAIGRYQGTPVRAEIDAIGNALGYRQRRGESQLGASTASKTVPPRKWPEVSALLGQKLHAASWYPTFQQETASLGFPLTQRALGDVGKHYTRILQLSAVAATLQENGYVSNLSDLMRFLELGRGQR
jgi:hypothetical protein